MANKRIKDIGTTITAFRTGDVIPVDGPSGTAKMAKDDLLRETAENAINLHPVRSYNNNDTSQLDVSDEHGNVIAEFSGGEFKTKKFNSRDGKVMPCISDDSLDITDEQGNVIAEFSEGELKTKNFDTRDVRYNYSVLYGLKYERQVDDAEIFEGCGLIGSFVKKNIGGVDVASTYSSGSELLVRVRNTTSITFNFVIGGSAPYVAYNVNDGAFTKVNTLSSTLTISGLDAFNWSVVRVRMGTFDISQDAYHTGSGAMNFSGLTIDSGAVVEPIVAKNRKILFIGDSITAGAALNVWQAYSYKLAEMLNCEQVNSCLPGIGLVNGSRAILPTTRELFEEMFVGEQTIVNTPDFVVVMIGTNDYGQTSSEDFVAEYEELLNDIIGRFGKVLIFACAPFAGYYVDEVEQACEGYDNVVSIDTTTLAGTYTTVDGTHPDASGAIVCANFVKNEINKVLPKSFYIN